MDGGEAGQDRGGAALAVVVGQAGPAYQPLGRGRQGGQRLQQGRLLPGGHEVLDAERGQLLVPQPQELRLAQALPPVAGVYNMTHSPAGRPRRA